MEKLITIKNFNEFKFKEKASLFIGQAYPVNNENEITEILTKIRKEHYNANHHCYAWMLYKNIFRYSDDGEPNGTAGIRIMNAIEHFGLTNILVISIRYFGGVKLGVGPLGKAYYYSAFNTLETCEKIEKTMYLLASIEYDFDFANKVHHYLNKHQGTILSNNYDSRPRIEFRILPENYEALNKDLVEISSGKIIAGTENRTFFL